MRHGRYPFILAFLAPPVLVYAVFVVSPYLQAFYISLMDWRGYSQDMRFVGLANYRRLFTDELFWKSLSHNAILLVTLPLVTIGLGLFFASMLNVGGRSRSAAVQGVRGSSVYKVVYFFPQVLAITIIAAIWQYIYTPEGGLLNGVLRAAGLGSLSRSWLADPGLALWAVLAVMVWMYVGFYVILFSAAMQSIPRDIYEAVLLDGATRWATFWRVTLPLLWDTVQVAWVYLGIIAIDAFALVLVMTQGPGGPDFSTRVIGLHMYQEAFDSSRFGYAAAIGVAAFFLALTMAVVAMRATRRERVEF